MSRPTWFRCSLVLVGVSVSAVAGARTQPLAEQPAVRHKYELRDKRFEIAPTFEASIAAQFKHTLSGGLKIEYHLTDTLSIGALGFFGTSVNTGLLDQIVDSLPTEPPDPMVARDPTKEQARQHANKMPIHGGVGVTFTPWFGKMGLFGRGFLSYDLYVSGGFAFALTKNDFPSMTLGDGTKIGDDSTVCDLDCTNPDVTKRLSNDPRNDGPHNAGFNPGVQFGGGLHLYFGNFAGLDVYIRDYMFSDNPSGFDTNHDGAVTNTDRSFLTHLFVGVGVSFFLPPKPRISK